MGGLFAPKQGPALSAALLVSLLAFVALCALLLRLPVRAKRSLMAACSFLAGLFYVAEYLYWEDSVLTTLKPEVANITGVIAALALLLGIANLCRVNALPILRRRPEAPYALVFFAGFLATLVTGVWSFHDPDNELVGYLYQRVFFETIFRSLGGTVFSLLAFYLVSAAYRAFRIRTAEASLMMATACVVLLGQVSLLTAWIPSDSPFFFLKVDWLQNWIMTVWNMAAQRAMYFGVAVGAVAMSLRLWLSLERGRFFEQEL